MTPADVGVVRTQMAALDMERSPSQASSIGDVAVIKQNMGDALRHQRHHHTGENSPPTSVPPSAASPSIESQHARKEELEANPWNN